MGEQSVPTVLADPVGAAGERSALAERLDRLSLAQALLDFDVANARVLDLTARLVEAHKRVLGLQADNDRLRAELAGLHAVPRGEPGDAGRAPAPIVGSSVVASSVVASSVVASTRPGRGVGAALRRVPGVARVAAVPGIRRVVGRWRARRRRGA